MTATAPLPQTIRTSLGILAATPAFNGRREGPMEDTIARVVGVFERLGIRWALVGAHAIGTFTEPRATKDFDFVVDQAKFRAVLKALEEELGDLDAVDLGPAMRLRAVDVDLIRSSNHSLFQEALRHIRPVEQWNVPRPEILLVLKFLAAVSPWRERTKKMQDVVDLSTLFAAVGREGLDGELLRTLAAQIYPGAVEELEALLGQLERGEPITI